MAAAGAGQANVVADLKKAVLDTFFGSEEAKYNGQLMEVRDKLKTRFFVDIDDWRKVDGDLAERVRADPINMVQAIEAALKEKITDLEPSFFSRVAASKKLFQDPEEGGDVVRLSVGFQGNFGDLQVTPRTLSARHLSHMVCVHGIVTRVSLVRPKVVRSVHYCPATGQHSQRNYSDGTDLSSKPTGSVYPTKDENGNPLETEFGLSIYRDSQTITIQEMPESAPLGQLPRSVEVAVDTDLVDTVKPGDRIAVYGIYRAQVGASASSVSTGNFRTVLLANNIRRLGKDATNLVITDRDEANIRDFATQMAEAKKNKTSFDGFDLIARSLAPSIYGHKYIKQSLALLLAGGVEHNLANGTHIRGDVNVLMVGDPSTAKSQLLRFVLNIAPVAVNTTGRGSSGVGLTAAVTTDPETGDRRLEAGAMVLADRGVVCIDEFDKMSDADRVAIHEVMEQQTVTIAKAGIQASLNARCSVVAAANPVYGRFDPSLPLAKNVALPDSLLSRFDLLFIVRDLQSKESDLRLAEHVLRMHRYVKPGQEGVPVRLDATVASEHQYEETENSDGTSPMYIKFNPLLHGGASAEGAATKEAPRLLSLDFIRKYVHYAKSNVKPKLTNKARARIVEHYNYFRQTTQGRATLITARSLETIIRLATAHAKLRLSEKVQPGDVAVAYGIMSYALYADASAVEQAQAQAQAERRDGQDGNGGDGPGGDDNDDGNDRPDAPHTPTKRDGAPPTGADEDVAGSPFGFDDDEDEGAGAGSKRKGKAAGAGATGKKARLVRVADDEDEDMEPANAEASAEQDLSLHLGASQTSTGDDEEDDSTEQPYAAFKDNGGEAAAREDPDTRAVSSVLNKYWRDDPEAAGGGGITIVELVKLLQRELSPASLRAKAADNTWLFPHLLSLEEGDKIMVVDEVVHSV